VSPPPVTANEDALSEVRIPDVQRDPSLSESLIPEPPELGSYGRLFDTMGFDRPKDLEAAGEILDAVFNDDREFLRERGFVVPSNLALSDGLVLQAVLAQMPDAITGRPSPSNTRMISAMGDDISASAQVLIDDCGLTPAQAVRGIDLQAV